MRTYGTLRFHEGKWHLKAEPHVFMRFDRTFLGATKFYTTQTAKVNNTPENARDLVWFCERFPLEMNDKDRARLSAGSNKYEETCASVERVLGVAFVPRPVELAIPPRAYQLLPAELALAGGGTISGDDVGLGKTVEGICLIVRPEARPALVVTLPHLVHQWEQEIKRFMPTARVQSIVTGSPYASKTEKARQEKEQDAALPLKAKKGKRVRSNFVGVAKLVEAGVPMPDVIVTAYSRLYGWREWLTGRIKSIVYDEVHELRNGLSTNKGQGAAMISSQALYRLGLTATPVYNYGGEMYNVVDMVTPGVLGSREEFGNTWCNGATDVKAIVENPGALGTYLRERGVFIRRTKQEVGREVPKVTIVPQACDCDEHEGTKHLTADVEATAKLVLSGKQLERGSAMEAAARLDWQMRQATGIAKAPYVAEFVRLLVESGEKVVLFAWHREVYDVLKDRLADLYPVFYTGTESPAAKVRAVEEFTQGAISKVFIASLRAGAGLDGLQHTSRIVVFGELDWTPAQHEQCIGRVSRDGQQFPVMAYYLLTDFGSDPVIADTLGIKRIQGESIREGRDASTVIEQRDPSGAKKLARSFLRSRGYTDAQLAEIEGIEEQDVPQENPKEVAPRTHAFMTEPVTPVKVQPTLFEEIST